MILALAFKSNPTHCASGPQKNTQVMLTVETCSDLAVVDRDTRYMHLLLSHQPTSVSERHCEAGPFCWSAGSDNQSRLGRRPKAPNPSPRKTLLIKGVVLFEGSDLISPHKLLRSYVHQAIDLSEPERVWKASAQRNQLLDPCGQKGAAQRRTNSYLDSQVAVFVQSLLLFLGSEVHRKKQRLAVQVLYKSLAPPRIDAETRNHIQIVCHTRPWPGHSIIRTAKCKFVTKDWTSPSKHQVDFVTTQCPSTPVLKKRFSWRANPWTCVPCCDVLTHHTTLPPNMKVHKASPSAGVRRHFHGS